MPFPLIPKSMREATANFAVPHEEKMRAQGYRPVGYYCRSCDDLRKDKNRLCICCTLFEDPEEVQTFIASHWSPVGVPVIRSKTITAYVFQE